MCVCEEGEGNTLCEVMLLSYCCHTHSHLSLWGFLACSGCAFGGGLASRSIVGAAATRTTRDDEPWSPTDPELMGKYGDSRSFF